MDKEYICGASFCKDSSLYGKQFYFEGTKFINIGDGKLIDNMNRFVCMVHSQLARDNILVGNDDGEGKKRYLLCKDIINFFRRNEQTQNLIHEVESKIDLMYNNKIFLKYNQNANDLLLPQIQGDNFYCAPIKDLQYIKKFLYNGED